MAKITYLIGAGASAGALPTVSEFPKALSGILESLRAIIHFVENGTMREQRHLFYNVKNDLEFLLEGCRNHMSVDTFCKMLYLTGRDEDYRKAKSSIILFFELYRYFNQSYDKRYDAFLATILNKDKPRFPNTINIISWNYDCEFEKAFLNYHNPPISMEEVYGELNVIHKNSKSVRGISNTFGIIKINGTTGFYKNNVPFLSLNTWKAEHKGSPNDPNAIYPIIEAYNKCVYDEQLDPMISFAWDEDNGERKMKEEIRDAVSNSDVLVIIGYSFPYFNRKTDKIIFELLGTNRSFVSKVYIQDLNAPMLQENVKRLRRKDMHIELVNNVDQFYIPHELD